MTVIVARPVPQRRNASQRHALVATSHTRLMMLLMLFAAAVTLVIGRLAMLGALSGRDAEARVAALAARGDIVDRNGAPLARTIDAWTIAVHPKKIIGDKMEIASRLAALMPDRGDQAWFYGQLSRNVSFVYLQRRASPALVEQVNAIGEPALGLRARDAATLSAIDDGEPRARLPLHRRPRHERDGAGARRTAARPDQGGAAGGSVARHARAGGAGERARPGDGDLLRARRGRHRARRATPAR